MLYQVSLLQALACGDYRGSVTIETLKRHGDTGLGTFHALNGEMIMLDGAVYRVMGDGRVESVSDSETTPFAVCACFTADASETVEELSEGHLKEKLNKMVETHGKNRFYMIRIDGVFRNMQVRSVCAQQEPYQPLVTVLERDQVIFTYENIEGSVVGLYCPPYLAQLNAVGWHMHFISKDKTRGGHVLGLSVADAVLSLDKIDGFRLQLPQNETFSQLDLTVDRSSEIEKIETNREGNRI